MERIPIIDNPKMFDLTISYLQKRLGADISWLGHIFGLAELCTRMIDGRKYNTANVFTGNEQYMQIEPCNELGNFCFFVLKDPQELSNKDENVVFSPFYAVFWYDMRKVSDEPYNRNREAVKAQILASLNNSHLPMGHIEINRIYERPQNIFSDFSYDYVDNQFLMSPYAGIRVDGKIWTEIPCGI